jgi:hypothetical protein
VASALAQTTLAGWKIVKDSKGVCQIAVLPDWEPLPETAGAAVFHDVTTAMAVATSQAGQVFKPLTETLQKMIGIRKDKLFENTARGIFYQVKISKRSEDPHAYSVSVPGKGGSVVVTS